MAALPLPDIRLVALAGGGLALVGGAVALADLGPSAGGDQRRAGIPVQTVRVGGDDWALRSGADAGDAAEEGGASTVAMVLPPSGRFGSAEVAAAAAVPVLPGVPAARIDDAFRAFDGASGRAFAAVPVATVPVAAVAYPVGPPRPKPALGTAPMVVASLGLPDAPTSARPSAPAAEPILAGDGAPRKMPRGAAPYLDIVRREAKAHGVPLWVALGVIWVESKFNPDLRGSHGVLGLMQVMPSTARYIGYKGTTEDLLKPEVNVKWGMKELAKDLRYARGELCLAVAKYKGGFMTRTINAGAQRYCDQMRAVTGMDGITRVAVPPGDGPKTASR